MTLHVSFWDLCAVTYDSLLAFPAYQELVKKAVKEVCASGAHSRVLDAGCGTGNVALALGREGCEVMGLDLSSAMLARAERKRRKAAVKSASFILADLEAPLPFCDASFDCVVAIHSLYAVRTPGAALGELSRVLKPSGRLVVSDFTRNVRLLPSLRALARERGVLRALAVCVKLAPLAPFLAVLNLKMRRRRATCQARPEVELRSDLEHAGLDLLSVSPAYADGAALFVLARKHEPAAPLPAGAPFGQSAAGRTLHQPTMIGG